MTTEPLALDAIAGAALLGVSKRAFHELRHRSDFPKPIDLFGPRRPRWLRATLVEWLQSRPVIDSPQAEPARLSSGRAKAGANRERGA